MYYREFEIWWGKLKLSRKKVITLKASELIVWYFLISGNYFITDCYLQDMFNMVYHKLKNIYENYTINYKISNEDIVNFVEENSDILELLNETVFVRTDNKRLPISMGDKYKINPVVAQLLNDYLRG